MKKQLLIFIVLLIVAIGLFIFVYNNKLNSNYEVVPRTSEQPKTEQPKEVVEQSTDEPKPRIWRGADYGLPAGVIVGGEQDDENPALNWVSIQQPDGHMTIAHNIDGRLWNAIEKGDIIE
jgi:hypothetical protein